MKGVSGTGDRAARDAATRWVAEGRRVRVAMPPNLAPTSTTFYRPQDQRGVPCRLKPPALPECETFIDQAPEMTTRETWPEPDTRLINDDRAPAPSLDDDALPAGWGPGSPRKLQHAHVRATTSLPD